MTDREKEIATIAASIIIECEHGSSQGLRQIIALRCRKIIDLIEGAKKDAKP